MYYSENDFRNYELYHHGILGQKWGRQQGPPYPLDASDHSSAEKKAGWRKSLDGGSKRESLGLRISKKSAERRSSKTDKLLNEIKNADLSTDKAKYKYAKKLAKALNAEDQNRAGNVAANEDARKNAKSYRDEARSVGLGKRADKILDAAENTSLEAKEYQKLASSGQARIKSLLKTADELGLAISSEKGDRTVGYGDDDYTSYFVPGVYYKAVKGSKKDLQDRTNRLEKLEKQDSGKHTEVTRKNEVEDYVSDRYDQLRKTMGSDDAMRKVVSEARVKYPNAFEEDENVYKNQDRDWWDDDDDDW